VLTPYRLRAGDTGPIHRSGSGGGAACLTVARMLVDPVFASWMLTGRPHPPGAPTGATPEERFAAYERIVRRRTNGVRGPDRHGNVPWPGRLGTAPWGAKRELERGASRDGTRYEVSMLRGADAEALAEAYEHLVEVLGEGAPALLYVGDGRRPRHTALVFPAGGDGALALYDPATGRVGHLRRDALVGRRLGLSGGDVPWIVVRPDGTQAVRSPGLMAWVRALARAPRASAPT